MFKSEKVKCYLQRAELTVDGDKRIARATFHITPITYDLAYEISPMIADRLFRGEDGNAAPSQEITSCSFVMNFPKQSLEFVRDPDYAGSRALIPEVAIKSISARKLFPDNPDFSLVFVCSFEITKDLRPLVGDLIELLHENIWLTFADLQPGLFDEGSAQGDTVTAAAIVETMQEPEPQRQDPLSENINDRVKLGRRKAKV